MEIIDKVVQSQVAPEFTGVIWVDISEPSTPVVKTYVNGEWRRTSGEEIQIASEEEILALFDEGGGEGSESSSS